VVRLQLSAFCKILSPGPHTSRRFADSCVESQRVAQAYLVRKLAQRRLSGKGKGGDLESALDAMFALGTAPCADGVRGSCVRWARCAARRLIWRSDPRMAWARSRQRGRRRRRGSRLRR
jgi:hypothetical protein